MPKTKIEKIAGIEEEIKQLKTRQKQLQQQHNEYERKARTKRLCKRAGLLESLLPGTIPLSEEQFKSFLEKTMLTDFTRRTLATIVAHDTAKTAPQATGTAAQPNHSHNQKPHHTAQNGGTRTAQNGTTKPTE